MFLSFSFKGKGKAPSSQDPPEETPNSSCTICDGSFAIPNDQTQRITPECSHLRDVCTDCLRQWISSRSRVSGWDNLICPSCSVPLQHNDVQTWAFPSDFERYDTAQLEQALKEMDTSFITCAFPDCQAKGRRDGFCNPETDSWVECYMCKRRTCVSCRAENHNEMTCAEYQIHRARKALDNRKRAKEKAKEEELSATHFANFERKKSYKTCPNTKCKARIEKVTGCEHVKCKPTKKVILASTPMIVDPSSSRTFLIIDPFPISPFSSPHLPLQPPLPLRIPKSPVQQKMLTYFLPRLPLQTRVLLALSGRLHHHPLARKRIPRPRLSTQYAESSAGDEG